MTASAIAMRPVNSTHRPQTNLRQQSQSAALRRPDPFTEVAPFHPPDSEESEREGLAFQGDLPQGENSLLKKQDIQFQNVDPFPLGRHLVGITDQPDFNLASWPDLDLGGLDQEDLDTYLKRKKAIRLFLQGASHAEIKKASGVGIRWIGRLVRERCMIIHPDGRIYGWRGLVRYARIAPYVRKKKVKPDPFGRGCAGSMQSLLRIEIEFERRFRKWILKTVPAAELGEINKPIHRIWEWFLEELRKLGYEVRNEWPFSTESRGYWAVARYVKQVMASNPSKAARLVGGKPLADKLKAGDGVDRPVHRPYQRVEMDAHSLNGLFCILVPHPHGGHVAKIVHRLWVIVILEVYSRAVLGYHLSLRSQVDKEDVLRTIKSALTRWQPRELSMGDARHADEAALPSGHHERYVGLCWDETSVDGALAETCKTVKDALRNVVGSVMIEPSQGWSARGLKDDRPFIESFFRTLGQRALNRMSNSTGSKPSDKGGRNPAQVALNSHFQVEYLQDLLDVLIANYNATEHAGLLYRSPLQLLDFAMTREGAPDVRRADPRLVSGLLSVRKMCTVKGGYRKGRRPYVNFYGASYSGEILIGRHDLVGKKICVTNHLVDDARIVQASTVDGHSLGVLRAAPPWHGLPHSLSVRSAIRPLLNKRKFRVASGGDAVGTFMRYAESSPDKKLPVHPAFLTMRRILAEVAQRREDADPGVQVEVARARLAERSEIRAQVSACEADDVAEPASAQARSKPTAEPAPQVHPRKGLPMHRMAASK